MYLTAQQFHSWVPAQENKCLHESVDSIIHHSPKVETTQMSLNWWINKMWYICTIEHCSAIERLKILMHTTTWMDFKNTMLSERSPKHHILCECVISLVGNFLQKKPTETESKIVAAWAGGETWRFTINGHEGSWWSGEDVVKLDGGEGCTTR